MATASAHLTTRKGGLKQGEGLAYLKSTTKWKGYNVDKAAQHTFEGKPWKYQVHWEHIPRGFQI